MKCWHRKQKQYHRKLYLEYRKKELLWYLEIFLSVNHPTWTATNFLNDFVAGKKTIRQMFTRVLICGGSLAYSDALPYEDDLNRVMGFMLYRQYIRVTDNMRFNDIMALDRVFGISVDQRYALRDKLLNIK